MELYHAGQLGMKWGYKKGNENGNRKAANDVKVDSSGNKYRQTDNGTIVYLDSKRQGSLPKAPKTSGAIRQNNRRISSKSMVYAFHKLQMSRLNTQSIDKGKGAIAKAVSK